MTHNNFTLNLVNQVLTITFNLPNRFNPFTSENMHELNNILIQEYLKPETKVIVLYGGKGRSFSSGGNFNEVSTFTGKDEVKEWLNHVNELYKTILKSPKPTIAAIEGYAIGFGLQMALLCDYRIGAHDCKLSMPELAKGIACNFGGYILEKVAGRHIMQKMLFDCEEIVGEEAVHFNLLHKFTKNEELMLIVQQMGEKMAKYPEVSFVETKANINKAFIDGLDGVCRQAEISHSNSFATGIAQANMKLILNKNKHQ